MFIYLLTLLLLLVLDNHLTLNNDLAILIPSIDYCIFQTELLIHRRVSQVAVICIHYCYRMETSRQLLFLSTTSLATRQQCSSLLGPISSTSHEILAYVCMTRQGHGRANVFVFVLFALQL